MWLFITAAGTHRGDEVGGGGGHSGSSGRGGVSERFGQKRPHHSITGKQQPPTQQPQWNVQLQAE